MATQATYDDANLILRLYEMRREDVMRKARSWFTANFKPKSMDDFRALAAPGTEGNAYFRQVSSYFQLVASFITAGVLNKELYFQSGGELLLVYLRIRPILKDFRAANTNPQAYFNLEQVGEDFLAWYDSKGPGTKDAIIGRMS
jgi:hypothetical protein